MNIKNKFKIFSFILSAALLASVCLFACTKDSDVPSDGDSVAAGTENENPSDGSNDEEDQSPSDGEQAPSTDGEDETPDENEKEPENEPEQEEPEEPVFRNPLTGLVCEESYVNKRPVAMMINNIKQAIPQLGISNADIMYECIVEGGITRLMCVFSDYENLPVTGSVRSSRDYYIDLAQSHDAIYAHCGGSEDAYSTIAARYIDNIDGVRGSQAEANSYWKDQDRVRNMGYEHASMTSGEKISNAVTALKFRTQINEGFAHPLHFYETETAIEGEDAMSVTVSYSGSYSRSFFAYDEANGEYKKGQYGEAHIDANTGKAVSFENLLLLGVSYRNTGDYYNHLVMTFEGEGKGYYVTGGKLKNIVWKKADRQSPYSLFEADGVTPLLINPGKTYIGLANGLSQVKYSATVDYTIE
ncbi:MAG: DUF3048 domain-containing protein [Ruminococcaceae bacterium]|nr:DUF3048 domain-containing protein [Oscillospiraceae bacterium]